MMMKDPKTGNFYDVDLRVPEQAGDAKRRGLVYACMHYFPEEESGADLSGNYDDIKAFWKQATGVEIAELGKDED
jgi:hypothetical protein